MPTPRTPQRERRDGPSRSRDGLASSGRASPATTMPRSALHGLPGVSTTILDGAQLDAQSSQPPPPLAPHLASAEAHLGRMTLTAPDNMLRRQAQERENQKKARRAAAAAAASAGMRKLTTRPPGSTPTAQATASSASASASSLLQSLYTDPSQNVQPPNHAIAPSGRGRTLSSSRVAQSGSAGAQGLQLRPEVPVEMEGSGDATLQPSMTRTTSEPAPNVQSADQEWSPERHDHQVRDLQVFNAGEGSTLPTTQPERATAYASPTVSDSGAQSDHGITRQGVLEADANVATDAVAPSSAGLLDVDDDIPPPPFPEGSTRPLSPPRAPPIQMDGYETPWSAEDQQRWADYRRLVPDSPPPPFESDSEEVDAPHPADTDTIEATSANVLSPGSDTNSDSELDSPSVPAIATDEDARAWEEDVRRGLSWEDRVHRLEWRRRRKEGMANARWAEERANEVAVRELLQQGQQEQQQQQEQQEQARSDLPVDVSSVQQTNEEAEGTIAVPTGTDLQSNATSTDPTPADPPADPPADSPTVRNKRSRPVQARPISRGGATAIRPRPISTSHTRFRDDATSAAERRRMAWGSPSSGLQPTEPRVATSPALPQQSEIRQGAETADQSHDVVDPDPNSVDFPVSPANRNEALSHRANQQTPHKVSFSESVSTDEDDGADTSSTSEDSAAEWAAEAAAFDAMRKAAEQTPTVLESDEESIEDVDEWAGQSRLQPSTEETLKRSLPKAPPPLALGRTRGGGIAYDASESETDSDSGAYSMRRQAEENSSDDSLSPDEDRLTRHVNPRWGNTQATEQSFPGRRSLDSSTEPTTTGRDKHFEKGKQAQRSHLSLQQARHAASEPDVSGSVDRTQSGEVRSSEAKKVSPSVAVEPVATRTSAEPVSARKASHSSLKRRASSSSASHRSLWQDPLPGAGPASRSEVNDRLKGLFAAPLPTDSGAPPVQKPVAQHGTKETTMKDGHQVLPNRIDDAVHTDQAGSSRLASRKRSSGSGLSEEQDLRRAALLDIARLQRGSGTGSKSLAALEKLLSAGSGRSAVPTSTSRSGLTRSGATRRAVPPSTRPRAPVDASDMADGITPLPRQPQLPTVTDATRHFPPSRAPTMTSSGGDDVRARLAATRPPVPGGRVSEPLSHFESAIGSRSVPPRPEQRLEQHEEPRSEQALTPNFVQPAPNSNLSDQQDHERRLRRRPPPPPPPRIPSTSSRAEVASISAVSPSDSGAQAESQNNSRSQAPELPPRPPLSMLHRLTRPDPAPQHGSERDDTTPLVSESSRLSPINTEARMPDPPTTSPGLPRHRRPLPTLMDVPRSSSGDGTTHEHPQTLRPASVEGGNGSHEPSAAAESDPDEEAAARTRREQSVGITDLDVMASRLEQEGSHFEELAAIQEFLGPNLANNTLSLTEINSLPCGRVEVERRRVTRDGKTKTKMACLGVRVDRCGICLGRFKEDQMCVVLQCLHVLHEAECARPWFRRRSRACPICRVEAVEAVEA